ncbi:S41 family peptidase [Flavobacterium sp. J372]|uniref:S41 family peptidase n=1 Tax=Flavobacterium sp. J372 TaxID=2898436 RepID=UPI0021518438|nr:S41 family peptidase [Flavobacterium sp. J372]MCR5863123.1 S41 family peptidase [Flavobacterium sp. J372]
MNKYIFAFISIFLLSVSTSAQLADTTRTYIDSSLTILRNHSLYSKKVNWNKIEKQIYAKAATAKNNTEIFDALKIAFNAVGDKHAAYYSYNDQYKIEDLELNARFTDSLRAALAKGPRVLNKMIGDVAYINIPFMGVQKQAQIDELANLVNNSIAALLKNNPKGWIIDLRLNAGGNIRPMLGGLAPFFKNGIVTYYIDRNGKAEEPSSFLDGDFYIDGIKQANINSKATTLAAAKVAVLIGPGTASSAEGVANVFHQRGNSKLFGEKSAGRANSTNGFVFNKNQSYFLISTSFLGDKNKKALPEYVMPDELVVQNNSFNDLAEDNAVKAAIKWLKK